MNRLFWAVVGAAAAILAFELFIPPVTGLADQGDFIRTIGRFGWGPQHHRDLEYKYVEPKYVPDPEYRQPYWEHANSEYIFVAAALAFNKLVSKDGAFDITVMGLVHVLVFLAVFARLLSTIRSRWIWIAALVIATDAAYAVYWNSFYTEPASCIFFLLLLAEAIGIAQGAAIDAGRMLRWSLWSVLWILAKAQNAPIGIVLALFTLSLAFRTPN